MQVDQAPVQYLAEQSTSASALRQRCPAIGMPDSGDPSSLVPRFRSSRGPHGGCSVRYRRAYSRRGWPPMLRCLTVALNAAISSPRWMVRRSRMLASISAYGRTGEFTNVDSSRRTPSSNSVAWLGGVARIKRDSHGGSVVDSAQEQRLASVALKETSRLGCSLAEDGGATLSEEGSSTLLTDLLRRPLSRFLFLRPLGVSLYFLLRALACCRR